MTPLERAARALCERDSRDPDEIFGAPGAEYPLWHLRREDARVVLTAIREPSEGMIDAAEDQEAQSPRGTAHNMWQAMIDQALEEGE